MASSQPSVHLYGARAWFTVLFGDEEFKESEHPRAEDGTFGRGAGKTKATAQHLSAKSEDGQRVTAEGEALPPHIQAAKIPPGWTDVTYSPDPNAHLLVTGRDTKGRRVYIRSDSADARTAAAKFARIQELQEKAVLVSLQNAAARRSRDAATKDTADAFSLIETMGIRPGSERDTAAKVKAYGATTLEGRHVVVEEGRMFLRFTGKKGVSINLPVEDRDMASMLRRRASAAGETGKLFPHTNAATLLKHTHKLDGGDFKTKDFRTLKGTTTAMGEVRRMSPPANEAEYKKAVLAVAKKVSAVLGNTPTVALQSYIDPIVFAQWRSAAHV